MLLRSLKFEEERVYVLRLRHQEGLSQDIRDVDVVEAALPRLDDPVLDVQDADDVVALILVDRDPRVVQLHQLVHVFARRVAQVDGEHVRPGRHDLVSKLVVEGEYLVDHLLAFLLDRAHLLAGLKHRHDLFFGVLLDRLEASLLRQNEACVGQDSRDQAERFCDGHHDPRVSSQSRGRFLRSLLRRLPRIEDAQHEEEASDHNDQHHVGDDRRMRNSLRRKRIREISVHQPHEEHAAHQAAEYLHHHR